MAADSFTSGAATAATAAQLRDEALATAKQLEEEAASLRSVNTERSLQLQEDADLLKSAAAAQDRVRAAVDALAKERAEASAFEQRAAALRVHHRDSGVQDADSLDDDDRSLTSDATAIVRLHNQAAVVQNIRNFVPLVLDL
jgi:small-conductance mechanosensitive channel